MDRLKFIQKPEESGAAGSSSCGCPEGTLLPLKTATPRTCCNTAEAATPEWITGTVMSGAGPVNRISTELSGSDYWEHVRCRTSAYRESYVVSPGIYAVGEPDKDSEVLVSANYKLSFDHLRRELKGLNVWVLVLDTKGINVWCAAGKGTFGSDELIRRISAAGLAGIVSHKRVIVPQLGAPGVSGRKVQQATGFRVLFGPVYAKDLPAYLAAGKVASAGMRTVMFPLIDRLILTPMEINPSMKKYPWFALLILVIFGLQPSGIIFRDAWTGGLPFLIFGLVAVFAGAFVTPVLLPFIPSRSFAVKGWITGAASMLLLTRVIPLQGGSYVPLLTFTYLFFPMASSYIALQFTGSTTFTGMSGVRKELKISMPVYLGSAAVSLVILIFYKLDEWRVL